MHPGQPRGELVALSDAEEGGGGDDEGAEQVEPQPQPAVGTRRQRPGQEL